MDQAYPFQWVSMSEDEEDMRQRLFPHDYSLMTKSVISNVRKNTSYFTFSLMQWKTGNVFNLQFRRQSCKRLIIPKQNKCFISLEMLFHFDFIHINLNNLKWSNAPAWELTFSFIKGYSINDVTQFWTLLDTPLPHRYAFYYYGYCFHKILDSYLP